MAQYPTGAKKPVDPGRPIRVSNQMQRPSDPQEVPENVRKEHIRLYGLGRRMQGTYSRFRKESAGETAMSLAPKSKDYGKDVNLPARTSSRKLTKR